jgi:AraC family ethanolamine operon transcriptional activator
MATRIDAQIRRGQVARKIPLNPAGAAFFAFATRAGDGSDDRRVSLLEQLVESDLLKISRSRDFDHFRSIQGIGDARSIPLHCRGFAASFASLRLKSCSVYLQRTFPRILQARYSTSGALVGFPMDDAASLTLNGVEGRAPSVLLVKGTATCEIVEPQANLIGFVNFDDIKDRGWPCGADSAQLVMTQPARIEALQAVTLEALKLASLSPDALLQPYAVESVEESILQAVDLAMDAALPKCEGKRLSLSHYLALVRKFDQFLVANAGKTVYSADVARQLGVSVRTLHNAVVAVRGMSMHRYTRLRRLWSVRQQLVSGVSQQSIKAVALVNGFWHMGEFTSLYRDLFGETPQQTLLASRRHQGELS